MHFDSLVGMPSPKATRKALSSTVQVLDNDESTKAYDAAYRAAMERIESQVDGHATLEKQVLAWIVFASGPVS